MRVLIHTWYAPAVCLVLISLLLLAPFAGQAEGDLVGFSVAPVLSENQRPQTQAYFDLQMKPGATQTLHVFISNLSDEDLYVRIEAVTPTTGTNGVIEYKPQTAAPTADGPSFSTLAEVAEDQLMIPAQQSLQASIMVTLPKEAYDGVLFGAIRVTKLLPHEIDPTAAQQNKGLAIHNQYTYAIGVVIRTAADDPAPDFALTSVSAERFEYTEALIYTLRNLKPLLINPMSITLAVYHGAEVIAEATNLNVKMTPEGEMQYVLYWPGEKPAPGEYSTILHIEYLEESWTFEETFQIDA